MRRWCVVLICISAWARGEASDRLPTTVELSALSHQVFAPSQEPSDLTVLRTLSKRATPPDPAQRRTVSKAIRQAETAIAQQDRSLGHAVTNEQVEQRIELAIRQWEIQQSRPLHMKQRFRINGFKYRLDQVTSNDVERVDADTEYVDTYVNMGNPLDGDNRTFHIDFRGKHAFKDNRNGTRWAQESISDLVGRNEAAELILKSAIGRVYYHGAARSFLPDADRLNRVAKGADADCQMLVRVGLYESQPSLVVSIRISPRRAREFKLNPATTQAEFTFTQNLEKCVKEELISQYSGKVVTSITRSGLSPDSQIPRTVVRKDYDESGALVSEHSITILDYQLTQVPDESFEFNPPDGFTVKDQRSGTGRQVPLIPTQWLPGDSVTLKWIMLGNFVPLVLVICILFRRKKKTMRKNSL